MPKKHIFLRVFSRITISVCAFCAFFISPVFATLPAGYTELEYIESTGTQYIDTGYSNINDTTNKYNLTVSVTSWTKSFGFYGAIVEAGDSNRVCMLWSNAGGKLRVSSGATLSSSSKYSGNYVLGQKFNKVIECDNANRMYSVDGIGGYSFAGSSNNANPITFGMSQSGQIGNVKYYSFDIYGNNRLVRSFIPARRNNDNEVGMYDTVTNTFFTNQGTGDFIAGPIAHCKTFGTDNVTCTACKSGYRLDNSGGCVEIIEIATTKMVDDEFAAAEAKLATTVQTIESVVSRTITQTGQIATLHETKQNRPDETCPANMKCLLVQDEDGTPHWYPIIEP